MNKIFKLVFGTVFTMLSLNNSYGTTNLPPWEQLQPITSYTFGDDTDYIISPSKNGEMALYLQSNTWITFVNKSRFLIKKNEALDTGGGGCNLANTASILLSGSIINRNGLNIYNSSSIVIKKGGIINNDYDMATYNSSQIEIEEDGKLTSSGTLHIKDESSLIINPNGTLEFTGGLLDLAKATSLAGNSGIIHFFGNAIIRLPDNIDKKANSFIFNFSNNSIVTMQYPKNGFWTSLERRVGNQIMTKERITLDDIFGKTGLRFEGDLSNIQIVPLVGTPISLDKAIADPLNNKDNANCTFDLGMIAKPVTVDLSTSHKTIYWKLLSEEDHQDTISLTGTGQLTFTSDCSVLFSKIEGKQASIEFQNKISNGDIDIGGSLTISSNGYSHESDSSIKVASLNISLYNILRITGRIKIGN